MCGLKYSLSQGFCSEYISEKGYMKTFCVSMRFLQGFPQYVMLCECRCEISDVEDMCGCGGNNGNANDKVKGNDKVGLG